jgi:hypothetical protein
VKFDVEVELEEEIDFEFVVLEFENICLDIKFEVVGFGSSKNNY